MSDLTRAFLDQSIDLLSETYLPKIEWCLAQLKEEELWWRPNEQSNSIGNLILHLSGNVRQWIISGLGGDQDRRVRQEEFDAKGGVSREELLKGLRSAVQGTEEVLRKMDPAILGETRMIQGKEVLVSYAVYHVVEHFAMHAGQIIQITKQRAGKDLEFYGFEKGKPVERWRSPR